MCSVFSFSPLHKKAKDDNYFLEDFAQNIINILTSLNVVTLLNQIAPRFLPLCYHILSPAKQWMLTPGCIPMVSFFNVFSSFFPSSRRLHQTAMAKGGTWMCPHWLILHSSCSSTSWPARSPVRSQALGCRKRQTHLTMGYTQHMPSWGGQLRASSLNVAAMSTPEIACSLQS